MLRRIFVLVATLLALGVAAPAQAQLASPVRAMIDAAIATGDRAKVQTVVDLARQTNPDERAEIDELWTRFEARQRLLTKARAASEERALRRAGALERWDGRVQIGAFRTTGNSRDIGVSASLELNRKGIDWEHRLRGAIDYQRSDGDTSREQYLTSYEPRYTFSPRLFTYGLAQYESDRIQGLDSRYALSGGLGYQVIERDNLNLSVQAGPAFRRTHFTDGTNASNIGALAGIDFDWEIVDGLKLTQATDYVAEGGGNAQLIVDGSSTSLLLVTGLEATIRSGFTTRLSYTVDHNSSPPVGSVETDTQTRFTLVYGF